MVIRFESFEAAVASLEATALWRLIIVLLPVFDQHLDLKEPVEDSRIEKLVP